MGKDPEIDTMTYWSLKLSSILESKDHVVFISVQSAQSMVPDAGPDPL